MDTIRKHKVEEPEAIGDEAGANGRPGGERDGRQGAPSDPPAPGVVEDAPGRGPATVQPGEAAAEEIRRLKEERDNLSDQLLRALADFDNARKRMQREIADQRVFAAIDALRAFLPVMDGFERALKAQGGSREDFQKGVEMIHRQMLDAARRAGLEPIEATGKKFDPHIHEAVETVETDQAADGVVLDELQRGYKLKDRLVRPAMVRVAHRPQKAG
jgi:molecular chaperone GrpE